MRKWIVRWFGVTLLGALTLSAQTPPKPDTEKKPDSAENKKPETPKEMRRKTKFSWRYCPISSKRCTCCR